MGTYYYSRRRGDYVYDIDCGEAAPPANAGRFFAQVVNMVRLEAGQTVLVSARFNTESGATLHAAVANIEAAVEAWVTAAMTTEHTTDDPPDDEHRALKDRHFESMWRSMGGLCGGD